MSLGEQPLDENEVAESLSPVATNERTYGRYQLEYEIASGGMASVYLARAVGAAGFERPIAIKRIHPHLAKKPIFVDMFLDEARLNARIAHPNVCTVFDFGEAEGSYFMAMEYLVGQPLSRVLGALSVRPELATSPRWHALAARILADACQGLHAAHELVDERGDPMNVVHRDFTPHNVFVTYDGAVKVFDFGVARAEGRLHQTETGMLKGKLAYMSPEQLARTKIDRRLDVWAAGVCLWELLTLRRLFGKRSEIEVVQAIGSEPILRPSQVRAGIPAGLDEITMRALERSPDRRTPTARLLARELNGLISTMGISTSMEDVAELMAELFPEERARKLDVVANLLRGEAVPIDMSETSAVQQRAARAASAMPVSNQGSRMPPRSPTTVRPAALRPPAREPTPAPYVRAPEPAPAPRAAPVEEEATTQSPVGLADMLEPSLSLELSLRALEAESRGEADDDDPNSFSEPPTVPAGRSILDAIAAEAASHTSGAPPGAALLADVAPARVEPAPVEPAQVEPAQVEPAQVEPAQVEPARSTWKGAALAGAVLAVLGVTVFAIVVSGILESGDGAVPPPTAPSTASTPPTTSVPTTSTPPDVQETQPPATTAGTTGGEGTTATPSGAGGGVPDAEEVADEGVDADAHEDTHEDDEAPEAPEAQGQPRQRRGSVNVAARGGWADLFVDGRPAGRTPRSLALPPGRHVVELRPQGRPAIRRFVTIQPGRTQRVIVDL